MSLMNEPALSLGEAPPSKSEHYKVPVRALQQIGQFCSYSWKKYRQRTIARMERDGINLLFMLKKGSDPVSVFLTYDMLNDLLPRELNALMEKGLAWARVEMMK